MPTAFCAEWSNGDGPVIGMYAEYDAVPGNCQAADTSRAPREGLIDAGRSILADIAAGRYTATVVASNETNTLTETTTVLIIKDEPLTGLTLDQDSPTTLASVSTSRYWSGLPTGAAIVLIAGGLFVLSLPVAPPRGCTLPNARRVLAERLVPM